RGNIGGPGNPFMRRMAHVRQLFAECMDDDTLRQLFAAFKERALAGDAAAGRLLMAYCVGRPVPVAEADRVGVEEFKLLRQMHVPSETIPDVQAGIPIRTANIMGHTAVWLKEKELNAMLGRVVNKETTLEEEAARDWERGQKMQEERENLHEILE